MSGMNWVDDDHVMHEVQAIVRRKPHELWINFSTGEIIPESAQTERLVKSVTNYRAGLEAHLRRNNVDPTALKDVTLHHKLTRRGGETVMIATDDRGVEHRIVVGDSA